MSTIVKLPKFELKRGVNILSQTQDWGIKQLNIPATWTITQGEGQTVLIIDTGKPDHQDIIDNIIDNKCVNFTSEDILDRNAHSTFCCSVVAALNDDKGVVGYAPKAKIITAKVLDSNGEGDLENVVKALQYALDIKNEITIVSMSLGSEVSDERVHNLIKELTQNNIPVICAAGNAGNVAGQDTVNYPARYSETLAIAAYDKDGNIAPFSSRGDELFISLPGVNIYGCGLNQSYIRLSGTSMACPAAAGTTALLLAKHKLQQAITGLNDCITVDQIKEHFIKHAIDKGIPNKDRDWGWGIINTVDLINENNITSQTAKNIELSLWSKIISFFNKKKA